MTAAAIVTFLVAAVLAFSMMMTTFMMISVMMAAFMSFTMMVAASMSFTMMVTASMSLAVMMTVVVTSGVGIIGERSFRKSLCGVIRRALDSGIEHDSHIRKRCLGSHADPAADQSVCFYCLQETRKGAVSVPVGINNLLIHDLSIFDVIQLELFGVAKVLEDLSVFICNCNSHGIRSFPDDFLIDLDRSIFTVSACDQQPFPIHKGISNLFPCAVIDGCDSGPGNVHPGCAGFLGKAFLIQQSQCLIFVNSHMNTFCGCDVVGREAAIDRKPLYSAASEGS